MTLKELSLNDTVYFKLTEYGEKRKDEIDEYFGEPKNGLYKSELWWIINYFKDTIGWGKDIEFVLLIED